MVLKLWRNKIVRRTLAILLWLPFTFGGCGWVLDQTFAGLCSNGVFTEVKAPNDHYKAVVFSRDCGATTGGSTQVSILLNNETLPNEAGNVFVARPHPGLGLVGPDGLNVTAQWLDDNNLQVNYAASARLSHVNSWRFVKTGLLSGRVVHISYVPQKPIPYGLRFPKSTAPSGHK